MKTDVYEHNKRVSEFNGPIMKTAIRNPIIHKIITMYAIGEIITKEEALSRMVVELAKDWKEEQRRACEAILAQSTVSYFRDQ